MKNLRLADLITLAIAVFIGVGVRMAVLKEFFPELLRRAVGD